MASLLLTALASTEPAVIYTSVDLLPDAELLHTELAKVLPEHQIPQIIPVNNFHELALVGEYILCLDALRQRQVD